MTGADKGTVLPSGPANGVSSSPDVSDFINGTLWSVSNDSGQIWFVSLLLFNYYV